MKNSTNQMIEQEHKASEEYGMVRHSNAMRIGNGTVAKQVKTDINFFCNPDSLFGGDSDNPKVVY